GRDVTKSAIAPYLRQDSFAVLHCPSDDGVRPQATGTYAAYRFSYTLNALLCMGAYAADDRGLGGTDPNWGALPGLSPDVNPQRGGTPGMGCYPDGDGNGAHPGTYRMRRSEGR